MLIWINHPDYDSRPFLLLDRDGVLNEDRPDYIKQRREFRFYPDALQALRWLRENQILVVLISNQSGLNRGLIAWEDFWEIHRGMVRDIQNAGGDLLGALYCPHRPEEACSCRKPLPGMIQAASDIFHFSLPETYLIGDRSSDLTAAGRAGCRGVFLDRSCGSAESRQLDAPGKPFKSFPNLMDAVLTLSESWERGREPIGNA
jgi:D-glycero-D-manno-heptose 1,7-bisphosphate phosphatase